MTYLSLRNQKGLVFQRCENFEMTFHQKKKKKTLVCQYNLIRISEAGDVFLNGCQTTLEPIDLLYQQCTYPVFSFIFSTLSCLVLQNYVNFYKAECHKSNKDSGNYIKRTCRRERC